jgi:mersacidin/lichenicidin family type 2 lantibiotic
MNAFDIIRAWKDEAYRASLSPAQLAALPANPAGMVELAETDLDQVVGGFRAVQEETAVYSGCEPIIRTSGTGSGSSTASKARKIAHSAKRR